MKFKFNKLKLQWKIFAYMLGFCGLLLFILWLFQTVFLTDMYKSIRKKEIKNAMELVEENINSPNLQTILQYLSDNKEILVTPSSDFKPPQPNMNHRDKRAMEVITETKEFTLQNNETISLTFNAMITPVSATIDTLRYQLYIITFIMITLSILLAFFIAKRVSKPIEVINDSAKALSKGKYDIEFTGKGFLEIEELSSTLNTAAAELSKVECLRRELMANISHDLRTPLSLIYSYAEVMHDFPNEISPEQTQVIMDETTRLTSLVNDVLDISKFENGEQSLNATTFNLTISIKETIERTSSLVKKDGYNLSFVYDEEVYVTADEVKIIQAFYNLLINAINYSNDNKIITIKQTVDDVIVKIEVIDNGDGILTEDLPYIWDRYYKVDKNHKRAITGTGLGLSIVKKIVEMHGGGYGVESTIGKGSTFWFSLNRI